jgi:hypothetical protein
MMKLTNAVRIVPFFVLTYMARSQSQAVECESINAPTAQANTKTGSGQADRRTGSGVAPQIQPRRTPAKAPPAPCRCGTVDAAALTAKSTSQEVPVLTGLAGTFRFDHVLLRETTQFASPTAGTLSVAIGRPAAGADVLSPLTLRNPAAPHSYLYDRPGPPQLTGAYDLALFFQSSFALGDGARSNYNTGTVTWEICGFNSPPARAR